MRLRPRRGFTAVEVTMVAAVIAILTLIALPMFRARIEESRRKAAMDEMSQIAKAEELAYAETGYHYRLNDLDNTTQFTDTDTSAPMAVPLFTWNRRLLLNPYGERWQLCHSDRGWNGPYMSFRKFEWLDRLWNKFDKAMFTIVGNPACQGPIFLYDPPGGQDLYQDPARNSDIYPLDPWGNPYLFFGIGALHPGSGGPDALDFPKCAVYSMGPNGQPGDGTPPITSPNYWRYPVIAYPGPNCLGLGDDLSFEF
ncbi:MAG: prepilin-type N-terminal cleavage/methylation domain-containing protein [Candidatus Sumerlaeota bacterium]|nr:prepilin-type N-terminal cleavage/methylation domain-containing protein [Candidatus Sumerlaeota bacterium]